MWNEIVTIIGLICLGNLLVEAKPVIWFREWLYRKIYKCTDYSMKWHYTLVSCAMCISFWVGLIGTQNILHAAIVSVFAELVNKKLRGGSLL